MLEVAPPYGRSANRLVSRAIAHCARDHPTLQIARGYWDRYYAPVLGKPGNPQLGIYSHMINAFLYLYR